MAFITQAESLAQLRATQIITSAADLAQLDWLSSVACAAVEADLGMVIEQRAITTTFDGGCYELRLQAPPRAADGGSITVSSVTESGTAVTSDGYVLRKQGWRLQRGSSTSRIPWASGWENISVTYTPGCVAPPKAARMVALYVVQSLWQSTQQRTHAALDESGALVIAEGALAGLPDPLRRGYESLRPLIAA